MDLVFRTLRGSIELRGLMDSVSISELKKMLHNQHKEGPLGVPDPHLQRLVSTRRCRCCPDDLTAAMPPVCDTTVAQAANRHA